MDKQRDAFVKEMNEIARAIRKTKSQYLKNDYQKALIHMRKELNDYDRFKKEAEKKKMR